MTDPDLSNLDRADRGMPPEYYGTADVHGYIVLFWILLALGTAAAAVSVYFIGWFVWTIVSFAVTTVFGGAS